MKCAIFKEALLQLQVELSSNRKTCHITYQCCSLKPNDCLLQLPSHLARLVLKPKPGHWISGLIIKENIKMVYIAHFVLSMMRDLNIYSNAMQDSEYLNS